MFLLLQALDLIRGKNVLLLMDSSLEGQYANEDATALVELASKCLQYEAKDRPDVKFLLTAVTPLQKQEVMYIYMLSIQALLHYLISFNNFPFYLNLLGCIACVDGSDKNPRCSAYHAFSSWKGLCKNGSHRCT